MIGLLLPREAGVWRPAAITACWSVRCTYVPVNSRWPRDRLLAVLTDCEARMLIRLRYGDDDFGLPTVCCEDLTGESSSSQEVCMEERDFLAYIMYTSGSTALGSLRGWPIGMRV